MHEVPLEEILIRPSETVQAAMARLDRTAKQILLVVDDDRRLIGTVTDGDIRRGILHGVPLDAPTSAVVDLRRRLQGPDRAQPVVADIGTAETELVRTMVRRGVRQIPLVDEAGVVQRVVFLEALTEETDLPVTGVIMAGGFGRRMGTLTSATPKPMLPVGDRPLLERTIERLRDCGIRRVNLTTHFRGDVIRDHLQDGRQLGVELAYVNEEQPLGTAGALGLLEDPTAPVLVINGDILTNLDFRAMYDFHAGHGADLTVALREYVIDVPYGVVDMVDVDVRGVREKPQLRSFVNAGIYLIEPGVFSYLPDAGRYDMTELIERLIQAKKKVVGFPVREYWRDIGHPEDYISADEDAREWDANEEPA